MKTPIYCNQPSIALRKLLAMIVTIHTIQCLHNDSSIASLDTFWHLHILSHQVLGFIQSWTNYRISSWQKIIIIA